MKEIDILINKALKYKESGLTDYEIAEELNISKETAGWLLNKTKNKKPTGDVKIGWKSIGVYSSRIGYISDALCDILLEESEKKEFDVDTIVGVSVNGIPYAAFVADKLGLELSVFRPHHEKSGAFSSNFATVKQKNVVVVDDMLGTGGTLKRAIKATKSEKGKPVLCLCVLNKRAVNELDGVPIRALIRARII
jgi:orotate phosphoribosyltransferase